MVYDELRKIAAAKIAHEAPGQTPSDWSGSIRFIDAEGNYVRSRARK